MPILVGHLSDTSQELYGKLLAPHLADPKNFFVISSDFCHWGSRFDYTFYRTSPEASSQKLRSGSKIESGAPDIWESIRDLDAEGIAAITHAQGKTASQAAESFRKYMAETKNTVCGCKPIGVLLRALASLEKEHGKQTECRFVRYEQSSKCHSVRDSSVSYASAFVRFLE